MTTTSQYRFDNVPCPECGCPYPGDHTLDCSAPKAEQPYNKMPDWGVATYFLGLFDDNLRASTNGKERQTQALARLTQWPLWRAKAALDCAYLKGMIGCNEP